MATIQAQLSKIASLDDQRKKIDAFKQLLGALISKQNIADLKVFIEARMSRVTQSTDITELVLTFLDSCFPGGDCYQPTDPSRLCARLC